MTIRDPLLQFELDQITENTALVSLIKLPADMQFLGGNRRGKRHCDQLAV